MLTKKLMRFIALITISTIILLSGCMTYTPQKAPCDQFASGCGPKIKINEC